MLAKLIKYEMKATSRILVPLYLILFFMSIVNRFIFKMSDDGKVLGLFNQFMVLTYILSIFIVLIVTFIYMIVRFYRNLLTDEGYLMFTLPVKTHQHITSKLLVTIFWSIISFAAVLLSLFIAFATVDSIPLISSGIKEAIESMSNELGGNWIMMSIELLIMFILGIISNILFIYVSIAVGQLFGKHKIIGSFAAYIIIYTALQFLMMLLLIPAGFYFSNNPPDASFIPRVFFPVSIAITALGCVCFFAATNYIFKRKLNLD